ncbi:MAG: hypothetical protein WC827_00410 [Candidatus Paceibacterota bacterium]|jgi:hypothetical protein
MKNWMLGALMMGLGFLLFVSVCTRTLGPCNKKSETQTKTEIEEVVATTLGWREIKSLPVPVVTTNASIYTYVSQLKFGFGDGPIHTALITKVVTFKYWKIGDEVLVVMVPGTVGNIPTPTFIVIDYRPQEQKK